MITRQQLDDYVARRVNLREAWDCGAFIAGWVDVCRPELCASRRLPTYTTRHQARAMMVQFGISTPRSYARAVERFTRSRLKRTFDPQPGDIAFMMSEGYPAAGIYTFEDEGVFRGVGGKMVVLPRDQIADIFVSVG